MADEKKDHAANWTPGVQLKITTLSNGEVEGEVFTYDATTDALVLRITFDLSCFVPVGRLTRLEEVKADGKRDLRIIKGQNVKDQTVVSRRTLSPQELNLPSTSMDRVREREDAALQVARTEAQKYGTGVTPAAQELFFALAKTLPCRWQGETIIVFDDIKVTSPYTPQSALGGTKESLARVQKIIEGERRRMEARK